MGIGDRGLGIGDCEQYKKDYILRRNYYQLRKYNAYNPYFMGEEAYDDDWETY